MAWDITTLSANGTNSNSLSIDIYDCEFHFKTTLQVVFKQNNILAANLTKKSSTETAITTQNDETK
jgi:hypothetical protein